jgi:hypothetical protein
MLLPVEGLSGLVGDDKVSRFVFGVIERRLGASYVGQN